MKMKAFLMFVLLFLCSMGTKAQDLGANYNENIDYPITEIEMLKQSKVTWVRGFVNIPNLFLQNENGKIVGVKENAIRTHIPTLKFIQAKKALGDRVKFILSLKIPFELYTDTVPKVGTKEMEYIFQATEVLLKTYDMAKNIEILVMGNEPEWENALDTDLCHADGEDYRAFLNEFANRLTAWKQANGWTFDIYAGALNRVSELPKSETVPAVVSVVNNNPNVAGLDLHVHALKINQAEDDFRIIRDKYGVTKKLICTEFSMVRALNPHVADALGEWGTKHGYTAGMKIYEYLNLIAEKANAGTPVSATEFKSLFESYSWYPKNWYKTFYEVFKKYDTYAITGRFSVVPGGARAVYDAKTEMNLGTRTGCRISQSIAYPDFIWIGSFQPCGIVHSLGNGDKTGISVTDEMEQSLIQSIVDPDGLEFHPWPGWRVSNGGQRELFIRWGNGADKTGILSVTDENGTEVARRSLDSENDYTLVENLVPGTAYHVALLKSDDAVLWKDDVKTKSVTGKFPLLKYQQVDEYMLVQLLNLPDDVSSYKVKLDGQEINIVNKNLNGQILTAEVTYKDGSVEILSTTIRK